MSLFGYYYLGLQSMSAARYGLQVAGDNIANVNTPGYARRRFDLTPGYPVNVPGGLLDQGVDVAGLRRMEDMFLQASLERELGRQAGSEEMLRGLEQIESLFGSLDGSGSISAALDEFAAAFDQLAAQPESIARRSGALTAAQQLTNTISGTYQRLIEQRQVENKAVSGLVERTNALAGELAALNREIAMEQSSGDVAAPLLDRRAVVIRELSELTGGSAATGTDGRVSFSFSGGPTLVTGDDALLLTTRRAVGGALRIFSGADGREITDSLRGGRLGGRLQIRDDVITARMADLDLLAANFTTMVNAKTTAALDLSGNAGAPLFIPDPPAAERAAASMAVNPALLADPSLLAISGTGAPGDGAIAVELAALIDNPVLALGRRSASDFVKDMLSRLGSDVVQADVDQSVAQSLVDGLQARQDAVSGVSLDEEAVELVKFQQSYEAAARFIQVLNSVTEVAIGLVSR